MPPQTRWKFTPGSYVWFGLAGFCYLIALFALLTDTVPEETRRMSWLSPGVFADVFGEYAIVGNWTIYGTAAIAGGLYDMWKAKP